MGESIHRVMSLVPILLLSLAINNFITYAIRLRRKIKKQIATLTGLTVISAIFFTYYTMVAQGYAESNMLLSSMAMVILLTLCVAAYKAYIQIGVR